MEDIALGMIETIGLVGLIVAADAAAKAAKVVIVDYEQAEGGLVIIKMRGSVAAVKAAVEAGAAAAQRVGKLWATHVIPNPDPQIEFMIRRKKPPQTETPQPAPKPQPPETPTEQVKPDITSPFQLSSTENIEEIIDKVKNYGIDYLSTSELRRLVRNIANFPFPPGTSGKMKREELISEFAKRGIIIPGVDKPIFPSGEGVERKIKVEEKEEESISPFVLEPEEGEEKIVHTLLTEGFEALHLRQLQHLARRFKNFPVLRIDQASKETLINGFKRGLIIKGYEDRIIKPAE